MVKTFSHVHRCNATKRYSNYIGKRRSDAAKLINADLNKIQKDIDEAENSPVITILGYFCILGRVLHNDWAYTIICLIFGGLLTNHTADEPIIVNYGKEGGL